MSADVLWFGSNFIADFTMPAHKSSSTLRFWFEFPLLECSRIRNIRFARAILNTLNWGAHWKFSRNAWDTREKKNLIIAGFSLVLSWVVFFVSLLSRVMFSFTLLSRVPRVASKAPMSASVRHVQATVRSICLSCRERKREIIMIRLRNISGAYRLLNISIITYEKPCGWHTAEGIFS